MIKNKVSKRIWLTVQDFYNYIQDGQVAKLTVNLQ
jgi:hypothetical protein